MNLFDLPSFSQKMLDFLFQLESEDGIYASSKEEVYGCIFGRDSAITILKILRIIGQNNSFTAEQKEHLITLCRTTLITLVQTQGKKVIIESGEEPGKFVHEFRKRDYEELINRFQGWYIYPDGTFRNYDSLDSTPLILIALFRFWEVTQDELFLTEALPAVLKGLTWIMEYGDRDNDYLLEYKFRKDRRYNGLRVQSWTDSVESIMNSHGQIPEYPIAPVEIQGYAYKALILWSHFFTARQDMLKKQDNIAEDMSFFAQQMKKRFNETFIIKDLSLSYAAQALDGQKRQIPTITANPLLLLWAGVAVDGCIECIVYNEYIPDFVKRGFASDMFESDAGIRTMSSSSPTFNPGQDSYHNGSFWPILNGMVYEGLLLWGFQKEAEELKKATLSAIISFKTPIELYIKGENGRLIEYKNKSGQVSCKNQAWSAASVLEMVTDR